MRSCRRFSHLNNNFLNYFLLCIFACSFCYYPKVLFIFCYVFCVQFDMQWSILMLFSVFHFVEMSLHLIYIQQTQQNFKFHPPFSILFIFKLFVWFSKKDLIWGFFFECSLNYYSTINDLIINLLHEWFHKLVFCVQQGKIRIYKIE